MTKPSPLSVLVIDDDPEVWANVADALGTPDVEITLETDALAALHSFNRVRPTLVFLSLGMSALGMDLLKQLLQLDPAANVIVMSTEYSENAALAVIREGACDFLTKPLDIGKLRSRVDSLRTEAELRHTTLSLDQRLVEAWTFEGIVSRSPRMLTVFAKIRRVAPHFKTALVTGATGTGKELVARGLHRLSPASNDRFVACNCSALVESLVETELFGYAKGAFTGANQDRAGLFESADGGTLLLDEIGELSPGVQAKLLRVLQDYQVQRVGSHLPRKVELRVIAATNRDLRAMVKLGTFREDLYYRLAMVELVLPRLEDRREDLPLLQRYFIEKFAAEYSRPIAGLTRRAQALMAAYTWPGNIRELENVVGNACMMAEGRFIDIHDLPDRLRDLPPRYSRTEEGLYSLQEAQRRHIVQVLERVGGNKQKAARILGVGRNTIYKALSAGKLGKRNLSA